MALKLYSEEDIYNIANAIREKSLTSNNYKVSEMSNAILNIQTGGGGDEYKNLCCDILSGTAENIVLNGVTDIGRMRMTEDGYSVHNLRSINFPDVVNVGYRSFYNCWNLTDINLPNVNIIGNGAFFNCVNLNNIYAPNVTFIDYDAFDNSGGWAASPSYGNTGGWIADFPNVTDISGSAFYNAAVKEVYLNNWEDPKGTGYIFSMCRYLKKAYCPKLNYVPAWSFQYCNNLTNFYAPNINSVGHYGLYDCENITSFDFPNLRQVSSYSFGSCYNLTEINFPLLNDFTGSGAFASCYNVINVNLPNVIHINGAETFSYCNNLTNIYMPNLETIASYTFKNTNFSSLVFDKLYLVGNYAFTNCVNLTDITFKNLNQMNQEVFNNCRNLYMVDIYTRANLHNYAFYNCVNLNTLILRANEVSGINANTFMYSPFNNGEANLYVPNDLISSYEAAPNWSTILAYPNVNILPIEGSPYEL